MINQFDVVMGAGPAGLACADVLKDSDYSVLVLEKKKRIGSKPCAGGIVESVEAVHLPGLKANILHDHQIHIKKRIYRFKSNIPLRIADRIELARYQAARLETSSRVVIRTGTAVRRIEPGRVRTSEGDYGYRFLVGADGAASVVRRYLGLPSKYAIGMYYDLSEITKHIIVYLDGKSLGSGYIWEFPHRQFTNIGIYYHPEYLRTANARDALRSYMQEKGYPIDGKTYRAYPIMYLYRGCEFPQHVFLAGDAAGLASRLTGEGISFALISGREIARRILNPDYGMNRLKLLVKRKRKQDHLANGFEKVPAGALNMLFHLSLKAFIRFKFT